VALFINYINLKFLSTESKSTIANTIRINMVLIWNMNSSFVAIIVV